MKNRRADIKLVYTILKDFTDLIKAGKEIILCWIPSHTGILVMRKLIWPKRLAWEILLLP